MWRRSIPANRRSASAARFCGGSRSRTTARPSDGAVHPQHPLGATMVSAEGACAAYYAYGRHLRPDKDDVSLTTISSGGSGMSSSGNPGAIRRRKLRCLPIGAKRSCDKCRESVEVKQQFFEHYADAIGEAQPEDGRALSPGPISSAVMGNGGSACDAQHVAVEFMHPIIEKRRALPALDSGERHPGAHRHFQRQGFRPRFRGSDSSFGRKPGDMALAISTSGRSA